jgi:hypothetical protein
MSWFGGGVAIVPFGAGLVAVQTVHLGSSKGPSSTAENSCWPPMASCMNRDGNARGVSSCSHLCLMQFRISFEILSGKEKELHDP